MEKTFQMNHLLIKIACLESKETKIRFKNRISSETTTQEILEIQNQITELRQKITQLGEEKKEELKNSISDNLFHDPQVQNYLGNYKKQKRPVPIYSITPLNSHTLEIMECAISPSIPYHSYYTNIKQRLTLLKESKQGIICYQEQEWQHPDTIDQFSRVKNANLSIKDPEKNNYIIEMNQGENEVLFQGKKYAPKDGVYYLNHAISKNTREDIQRQFSDSCLDCMDYIPTQDFQYFKYLKEQETQIRLLEELNHYRKKTKD